MKAKIITLVDNITYKPGLKAEHGLSFLVKTDGGHILFDTGQSDLFLHNAREMGEKLTLVDHVVLSHGHYDHAGGIETFMAINAKAQLWIHPQAVEPKFSTSTGEVRLIGILCDIGKYADRVNYVEKPTEIMPDVWLLPQIARTTTYETDSTKLLTGNAPDFMPDPFDDELALYVRHADGLTLVSGCAHRGIVNTLKAVMNHSGMQKFKLVTGGTHLNGAPSHRLEATAQAINAMQVESFWPNHCTGISAFSYLSANLKCRVAYAQTGTIVCAE